MSIKLDHNYDVGLQDARPTSFGVQTVHPPPGVQGTTHVIPAQTIPPINTNIDFSMASTFQATAHPGLSAISPEEIPKAFNWRDGPFNSDQKSKVPLITTPGNQLLCGSCWAIAGAGIVGDNFVVSGVVDWKPDLSTTYSLACYPQKQCQGGNPALLFNDIAKGGLLSKHCIDYTWCETNPNCNGKGEKHFEKGKHVNLSPLIPSCGCYEKGSFYRFKIDGGAKKGPQRLSWGVDGLNEKTFPSTIKRQIFTRGPVLGGFLVFKNFMKGAFTKTHGNKGIYLENGVYNQGDDVRFDDKQTASEQYSGSHAVAVIGWGVEKDVKVDNKGTKKDVPYWFCRNSWGTKWGDGGYFKIAMNPYNKISQFDKTVTIQSPQGNVVGGGMVLLSATTTPEKVSSDQVDPKFRGSDRSHGQKYYTDDPKDRPTATKKQGKGGGIKLNVSWKPIVIVLAVLGILGLMFLLGYLLGDRKEKQLQYLLIASICILSLFLSVAVVRLLVLNYCDTRCSTN